MKICCVLVTYNRLEKLKTALAAYAKQTLAPNEIIVVNNKSTDGTEEYLAKWQAKEENGTKKTIMNLGENLGGSGGFYLGFEKASQGNCDWMFIADDDAYPLPDCLELLARGVEENSDKKNLGCVAGTVIFPDGDPQEGHRRLMKKGFIKVHDDAVPSEYYQTPDVKEIDTYSFVGALLNLDAVRDIGLPKKDYFIWHDDTEYSLRMGQKYQILLCPAAKIIHDTPKNVALVFDWKQYYGMRNQLDIFTHYYPGRFTRMKRRWLKLKKLVWALKGDKQKAFLVKNALRDFKQKRFGKNELYLPGKQLPTK